MDDLSRVDRADWDGLEHGPSPFLEWGFLRALEETGSVGDGTGWYPHYLLAHVEPEHGPKRLVGAAPAYIKTNSYGEYIFDWSWARAAQRAGIAYYPKIVIAAPATPATGNRILLAPGVDADLVTQALVAGVFEIAKEAGCSGIHWLFATKEESRRLCALGFAERSSYQFHWHNRGYKSFDDFLATFTSRKRKQIRKERRRALAAIDDLEFVAGVDLSPSDLVTMDRLYRNNVWAHGGMDYLKQGFFHRLAEYSPDRLLFARARRGSRTVAGGIYLETEHGLYGRYWGCVEHIEFLHFEVAYYAGIERCIERGTPLFEAGAQGEHKLLRGFEPSRTYSCHFICFPQLDEAIRGFLREEAQEVEHRMAGLSQYGPYKRTD